LAILFYFKTRNRQSYFEENGVEIAEADFERIPKDTKKLSEEETAEVEKLIECIEEEDDVQTLSKKEVGNWILLDYTAQKHFSEAKIDFLQKNTLPLRNWPLTISQLYIKFGDRLRVGEESFIGY